MRRIARFAQGCTFGYLAVAAVAAVAEQLGQAPVERTWHGRVAGIPYDFRFPSLSRMRRTWWNPENPHLFVPRGFGMGWDINLYRLTRPGQTRSGQETMGAEG